MIGYIFVSNHCAVVRINIVKTLQCAWYIVKTFT